jgi:hypothetical protein
MKTTNTSYMGKTKKWFYENHYNLIQHKDYWCAVKETELHLDTSLTNLYNFLSQKK